MTPRKHVNTITGLRPIRSEMPDTKKLPNVAETPKVPISQPICVGVNPRSFVKNNGANAQQITRYDTRMMAMQAHKGIFRWAQISLKRLSNDWRGSDAAAAGAAGSSM